MKGSSWVGALFAATFLAAPAWVQGAAVVNVTEHGAVGDGKTLDRAALNRAIEACAGAGGGQVRVPPGRYLTGTVRLRSGITLVLDAGAVLVGTPNLDQYESYAPPESRPGDRNHWHRALILGVGVENVTITGPGVIDGNKVPDPQGEGHMRGPHAVLFGDSRNVVLREVRISDAASYAILLERTSHVEVRGIECTGGWDGVHFRGRKDQPCRGVPIIDCEFFTGGRLHRGRLLAGHADRPVRDQLLVQRHPADRPGAEPDRPRLPVLWARPPRAPHVGREAPHQHGWPASASSLALGCRQKVSKPRLQCSLGRPSVGNCGGVRRPSP